MSIKNFFKNDRFNKKNILEFFDRKGFYIIVILSVIVVGVTAFIVTSNKIASSDRGIEMDDIIPEDYGKGDFLPDEDNESFEKVDIESDTETGGEELEPIGAPLSEPEEKIVMAEPYEELGTADNETGNDNISNEVEEKTNEEIEIEIVLKDVPTSEKNDIQQKFIMPVTGEITFDYAMDKLVYSKTLDDWRTHSGIDIASPWGTNVKAVADGVVTDIKNDPRLGITVIVEHDNGLKTVYCNLAAGDTVNPNQKVKQGDFIGCVGNTALFESAEQPHLHFEVLKDNENVDPKLYLPISK